jgi:hypothetical protein
VILTRADRKPAYSNTCGPLPKNKVGHPCSKRSNRSTWHRKWPWRFAWVKNSDTHNMVVIRLQTGVSTGQLCGNAWSEWLWVGGNETRTGPSAGGREGGGRFLLQRTPARSGYILLLKQCSWGWALDSGYLGIVLTSVFMETVYQYFSLNLYQ